MKPRVVTLEGNDRHTKSKFIEVVFVGLDQNYKGFSYSRLLTSEELRRKNNASR
jgi:hypothetical protein